MARWKNTGKPLKDMDAGERRAYHRAATERWRQRNPDYKRIAEERRLARMAAETPQEREVRLAQLRAYRAPRRALMNEQARAWRLANPEKVAEITRRAYYKDLEKSRARNRASAKRNYERAKPRLRAHRNLRRARVKGAKKGEPIRLDVLAERESWRCHICGKRVTEKTWSMDHLVPISKGGDHTYENVSLAHRLCNVRRHAGRTPAQLRLIG